ncbi:MAG: iron-containing alcohol dehydrogenase, partial [Clostridia bacterium]|nr:iron-containing alcohol dehydrogenase [Clostridia bacterium]
IQSVCLFEDALLVPDEKSIAAIRAQMTEDTDLVLGIGSGVINDLCKYVAFYAGIRSGIIATAPSMDGYASSGAAMILDGMKVTDTTNAPTLILGDVDILKDAPMEMIRSGYADIIGKYSALCDWKLSALINGEYLCPFVYDLVKQKTDDIRRSAVALTRREPWAIGELMETLVLIGACLTLLSTTRPGSGSEHHLSHYFEITGLLQNKPYFLHGTDVGYSTVVTAALREEIGQVKEPVFHHLSEETRDACYRAVYGKCRKEVRDLQRTAGRYDRPMDEIYRTHWQQVLDILAECPTADEIRTMLTDVGFDLSAFEAMYGKEKIQTGIWLAKDLKDRYSVLWLYDDLFFTEAEANRVADDGMFGVMHRAVENEAVSVARLAEEMDREEFLKALTILLKSKMTVTSACGSSGFAAKKFAHSLCCIECPAKFVPPSEAVHGGMGALQAGNALVLVSKGGKTDELLPLCDIAKQKGCPILVITAKPEAALAKAADAVLRLPDVPESDRYGVMSTASFAATIAIFDALMMGLMEAKDYPLSDFALIHPGGAVGKQIG